MAMAVATAAEPAASPRLFSIRPEPYADALVDFALQAGLSIGGIAACSGNTPGLQGSFTPEDGLRRLLAGAPCRYDFADAGVVRLTAIPVKIETIATPPLPAPPEEVTVTATKRAAAIDRLPDAVSVISTAQLAGADDIDVADTVSRIAGMNMTNLGPGRDKIMLRGLSGGTFTGRTQSTVGTYLDGLAVNYNAPDPDLRLSDIEAIEVLRGPQGALYGGGSLSGVYRIVTRKPDLQNYSADLSAGYDWTQGASSSRSANGMVNLPLAEGIAALRVVGYGDLEGGYLNNSAMRQSDVDRTIRNGGRAALETRLGDDWTVTAGGTVQTLDTADAQYIVGSRPRNRANRVGENGHNDFAQASIVIAETGEWGRLESSTGYIHHALANRYDASAALSLFDDDDSNDVGVYDERTSTDLLIEDLIATSSGDGPLQWLGGIYGTGLLERTSDVLRSRGTGKTELLRYQEARTDRQSEVAPYGEVSYDFGGWTLSFGARLFETGLHTGSDVILPQRPAPRLLRRENSYRGWVPKVSLRHEFSPDDMAYLLYSEGYRAGGFNSGGIAALAPRQRSFAPDRLRNIELGAKSRMADGAVELRSAVFCGLWNDIQTDQYQSSGLSYTANIGDARVWGWENEALLRPLPGLTLGINDLLDTARLSATAPASPLITTGLPGEPALSFGATLDYEMPLDSDFTLLLGGETSYVGRSRLTFQPGLSPWMGGYFTAKLTAGLQADGWRLTAILDNPANTQGDTFAFGNPFSFGQVRQVTPLRPRTARFVLSAHF